MAIPAKCTCRRWSAKRWVFVSLSVILALIPIIIAFSIGLRPRSISLSIGNAMKIDKDNGMALNLTIFASNKDKHTGVEYRSVLVDLLYTRQHSSTKYSVPAEVKMASTPLHQPPNNTTTMEVAVDFTEDVWMADFKGKTTNITVLITTSVQFIVGPAYTLPYTVSVSCVPTDFFNLSSDTTFSINCTG